MINDIFAQRIKNLRSEKGYSQKKLGDLVGVSKVSIFNYENGLQHSLGSIPAIHLFKNCYAF